MHFYIRSKWYAVNIDDRLPVEKHYGKYYYTWATGPSEAHAWWMPLMEKAFAKVH